MRKSKSVLSVLFLFIIAVCLIGFSVIFSGCDVKTRRDRGTYKTTPTVTTQFQKSDYDRSNRYLDSNGYINGYNSNSSSAGTNSSYYKSGTSYQFTNTNTTNYGNYVYTTRTGNCYHKPGCPYARQEYKRYSSSSQVSKKYRPCKHCYGSY